MNSKLYDRDLYAWATANAELIRHGKLSEIDAAHVAEELESMARSRRRELVNRLAVIVAHLIKWQYQPAIRSNSWKNNIGVQRDDAVELLEESPSLRHEMDDKSERAYKKARRLAAADMGLSAELFPESCPYSFDQIMDENFWPEF
jgi:hypothetical protein